MFCYIFFVPLLVAKRPSVHSLDAFSNSEKFYHIVVGTRSRSLELQCRTCPFINLNAARMISFWYKSMWSQLIGPKDKIHNFAWVRRPKRYNISEIKPNKRNWNVNMVRARSPMFTRSRIYFCLSTEHCCRVSREHCAARNRVATRFPHSRPSPNHAHHHKTIMLHARSPFSRNEIVKICFSKFFEVYRQHCRLPSTASHLYICILYIYLYGL